MGKKKNVKQKKLSRQETVTSPKGFASQLAWPFAAVLITTICLWPLLKNGFTNWDDEYYVVSNALPCGPQLNAVADARIASRKGVTIPESYQSILNTVR